MSLADGDGRGVHVVITIVGNGSLGDFVAGPGAGRREEGEQSPSDVDR